MGLAHREHPSAAAVACRVAVPADRSPGPGRCRRRRPAGAGCWPAGARAGPKPAVPVSIEHSKVEPASVEWKPKVGRASVVGPSGRRSIDGRGAVGVDGEALGRGAWVELCGESVARTRKV